MTLKAKPDAAVLSLSDQIRAVALEGLKFSKDPYDRARYELLLDLATQEFAAAVDIDTETMKEQFRRELGSVTPKLGADAAVINTRGQLLAVNRADKTGWCLPCGWVDVGESPAAAAVREVHEETGVAVEPLGYLSISTKGPGQTQNIQHQVNIITIMKPVTDDTIVTINHEHIGYEWIDSVDGRTWHPGHDKQAARIFAYLKDKKLLLPVI